jgi:hypothetical protein
MLAILIAALLFVPAYAQQSVTLEVTSDQGSFLVQVNWMPAEAGEENAFDITFIEPETGTELEDIKYEFSLIHNDTQAQEAHKVDQTAAQQKFTFDEPGWYTIRIGNIDGLDESAEIPIQVTPEFPAGALVGVAAIGAAVAAGKIYLSRLQDK